MIENETRGGWVATLSLYAAWAVASIGAILDALFIREMFLALLAWYNVLATDAYHRAGGVGNNLITGFGVSAVDNFILLLLACGAIAATIWIEYYFRKGRPLGLLYKRIGRVFLIELIIVVAALVIRQFVATFI